jgi:hypothetical protein
MGLSFTGVAGDTWYIVVDGATAGDTGAYSLEVTVRPTRAMDDECDLAGVTNVCFPQTLICVDDGSGVDGTCM